MSVTIYYAPVKEKTGVGGISSDVDALREVFGQFPITLKFMRDHEILNAMCATTRFVDGPYNKIYRALEKYQEIILTAEY